MLRDIDIDKWRKSEEAFIKEYGHQPVSRYDWSVVIAIYNNI